MTKVVLMILMILTGDQHNNFKSAVPSGDLGSCNKICTQGAGKINNEPLYPLTVPGLVRPRVCFGFLFVWVFLF